MRTDIDYRDKANRLVGFDRFYQFHCKTNDCSPDIAVEKWIADDLDFNFEKRCVMALFHGATYAGPCESMFADKFPVMTSDVSEQIKFFQANKKRLLFSPDCKYRKIVFEKFLESIGRSIEPYGTLGGFISSCFTKPWTIDGELEYLPAEKKLNYLHLQQKCFREWWSWGRMGHWCFSEALERFISAPIKPPTMEFETGKSHRSGWAFCIGRDDLTGDSISKEDIIMLEKSAAEYIESFKKKHPDIPNVGFFTLETACCNYKRQHKGSRYGGCYVDEQYVETMQMKKDWPEYNWLWDKYLEGRQAVIPSSLLYENHKDEEQNDSHEAYIKSWTKALKDYGRIPRIEAWHNNKPQIWTELSNLPFVEKDSSLVGLFCG